MRRSIRTHGIGSLSSSPPFLGEHEPSELTYLASLLTEFQLIHVYGGYAVNSTSGPKRSVYGFINHKLNTHCLLPLVTSQISGRHVILLLIQQVHSRLLLSQLS
jgi:hypothetical protein